MVNLGLAAMSVFYVWMRWQYVCDAFFMQIPHLSVISIGKPDTLDSKLLALKLWNEDIYLLCMKLLVLYIQTITDHKAASYTKE